ncbi:hypothetical protein CXH12_09110 [Citrobacter portucalensis]|nr:hypothetical protein CXH12_09110 [Citrobacter portucalensis]RWT95876.1 hypothetical protein DN590_09400 [Citrobacter freundii]
MASWLDYMRLAMPDGAFAYQAYGKCFCRLDKAFYAAIRQTHQSKSKGCARICVTRGNCGCWRGAKPHQTRD